MTHLLPAPSHTTVFMYLGFHTIIPYRNSNIEVTSSLSAFPKDGAFWYNNKSEETYTRPGIEMMNINIYIYIFILYGVSWELSRLPYLVRLPAIAVPQKWKGLNHNPNNTPLHLLITHGTSPALSVRKCNHAVFWKQIINTRLRESDTLTNMIADTIQHNGDRRQRVLSL